jgi:hypothetical protein
MLSFYLPKQEHVHYMKHLYYETHLRPGLKKVVLTEESYQISFKVRIKFPTIPKQFQADNVKNLGITLNITAANNKICLLIKGP